jgi:hypothetical protein
MGATSFTHVIHTDVPLQSAFSEAYEQAAYDYGHAGYTGTIAEKPGAIHFVLPEGVTPEEALSALQNSYAYWDSGLRTEVPGKVPEWAGRMKPGAWERMADVYNDKWGEAVAFKTEDGWLFCGWASC